VQILLSLLFHGACKGVNTVSLFAAIKPGIIKMIPGLISADTSDLVGLFKTVYYSIFLTEYGSSIFI